MMCITENIEEMLTAPVAPGKRKRVSKKNKKAWRKHTKINDVEKFLQDKLREERTGGDPSLRGNKDLFFIDKSDMFMKPKQKLENMKCHIELQVDTRAPAISARPAAPKKSKKKQSQKLVKSEFKRPDQQLKTAKYDIWSTALPRKELDPSLPPPKKQPSRYVTCDSVVPAVVPAHPGSSYNPTFEQHQDLLKDAHMMEADRMKEQDKIKRMKPIVIAATEEQYLEEMSIGLNQEEEEEKEEEVEVVVEEKSVKEIVLKTNSHVNRKTKAQRAKERLEKKKKAELLAAKHSKKVNHDLLRVKSLTKQLKTERAKQLIITEKKQKKRKVLETRPGKFGPEKFAETLPEFHLPEEISSSLRKLDPQGSLLTDRFLNMQRRNMIEVRKKVIPHRKYKLKYVEKWSKKLPEELHELVKLQKRKQKNAPDK